jgi:hypothetical protein
VHCAQCGRYKDELDVLPDHKILEDGGDRRALRRQRREAWKLATGILSQGLTPVMKINLVLKFQRI